MSPESVEAEAGDEETVDVLRAVAREAQSFIRLALLLPRDLPIDVPTDLRAGDDVVVLVHGALATAGAWRPLRQQLERLGVRTAAFTYGPSKGVVGIAETLARLVAGLPEGVRLHLVGHSLGGLAVRWFVQEHPADPRVVQTIAVGTPFEGARGARLFPGPAGRDMCRGSHVLERLSARARERALPHLSIFGTADTAVAVDTEFPAGDRVLVRDAAHNTLLFDPDVAEHVIARVSRARAAAEPGRP